MVHVCCDRFGNLTTDRSVSATTSIHFTTLCKISIVIELRQYIVRLRVLALSPLTPCDQTAPKRFSVNQRYPTDVLYDSFGLSFVAARDTFLPTFTTQSSGFQVDDNGSHPDWSSYLSFASVFRVSNGWLCNSGFLLTCDWHFPNFKQLSDLL